MVKQVANFDIGIWSHHCRTMQPQALTTESPASWDRTKESDTEKIVTLNKSDQNKGCSHAGKVPGVPKVRKLCVCVLWAGRGGLQLLPGTDYFYLMSL